jgi:hydrogenase-1 operon protein HyaE
MTLHPLVERLITHHGAQPITLHTLPAWLEQDGDQVLFFAGDPVRFPEGVDVAVVLPELQAAFSRRFQIGVVQRDDEDAIARRFGSQRWPALVFLRDGQYVATIAGMRDWEVYLREIGQALQTPATRAPTVGIPIVGAGGGAAACH